MLTSIDEFSGVVDPVLPPAWITPNFCCSHLCWESHQKICECLKIHTSIYEVCSQLICLVWSNVRFILLMFKVQRMGKVWLKRLAVAFCSVKGSAKKVLLMSPVPFLLVFSYILYIPKETPLNPLAYTCPILHRNYLLALTLIMLSSSTANTSNSMSYGHSTGLLGNYPSSSPRIHHGSGIGDYPETGGSQSSYGSMENYDNYNHSYRDYGQVCLCWQGVGF